MAGLWRALPRDARHRLLAVLSRAAAPARAAPGDARPGPVTVAGLLSTASGLGESARLCHAALCELGVAINALDLSARIGRADLPAPASSAPAPEPGEGGALILHLNAPHLPMALAMIGRRVLRHKRIIAYWAWELEVVPRAWRKSLRYVHEVWVPSAFVADAIRRETDVPVRVVPHPVAVPLRSARTRADFELAGGDFVALAMLDARSGWFRKNPIGAVRAFRRAFGGRAGAVLVLKISGAHEAPQAYRALLDEIGGAPDVRLLEESLSRADQGALLACADVVLSLHRSEGFGLVLAEAMRLGRPVVATGWSGNMQFMSTRNAALVDYRLVPVRDPQGIYREQGARWAEPDVDDAARWLQRLADEASLRERLGAAARADAARLFGAAAYARAIAEPLQAMARHDAAAPGEVS